MYDNMNMNVNNNYQEPAVNNKKSNKKGLVGVITFFSICLIAIGGYFIYSRSKENYSFAISTDDSKLYPNFSDNVEEYLIYTDKDRIKFNCPINDKNSGCNEVINLTQEKTNHIIKYNGKNYKIKIVKVEDDNSIVKVEDVKGAPTMWAKEATLKVSVDNPDNIKKLKYSFDGGLTYQTSPTKTIKKNGKYSIVVKDYFGFVSEKKDIEVSYIDSTAPVVNVTKTKLPDGKIMLSAEAEDTDSGIKSYTWSNGSTEKQITVDAGGNYTVKVSDTSGNITTSNINMDDILHSVTFDSNGSDQDTIITPCTQKENCKIKAPNIMKNGYEILGWSINKDATSAEVKVDSEIVVTKDVTYYAITKRTIGANFVAQDNQALKINGSYVSCDLYNRMTSCSINIPNVQVTNGYQMIGWNTSEKQRGASINIQGSLEINSNTTFYSITYNQTPVTVTFKKNGSNQTESTLSCYRYNGEGSCNITSPNINPADGFSVLGWNINGNAQNGEWGVNQNKSFSVNTTYYAITRSNTINRASFVLQDDNAATLEKNTSSCYRYNGATTCDVQVPNLTAKTNYEVVGWSDKANDINKKVDNGKKVTLSSNVTYYSITKDTRPVVITFDKNNAKEIGTTNNTCYKYNGKKTCTIKSPKIIPKDGYEVVGWDKSKDATTATWDAEINKESDKSTTYYAITKGDEKYNTALFILNDSNAADIIEISQSCTSGGTENSCTVKIPELDINAGYELVGWSTAQNSEVATNQSGDDVVLSNNNTIYYAITKNTTPVVITFDKNSAQSISDTSKSCYKYNGKSTCMITTPEITVNDGFSILGWDKNSNATSATWNVNSKYSVSENTTYYAIIKQGVKYNVTFEVQDENAVTASKISDSCTPGANNSCEVTVPILIGKTGYEVIGWSTDKNAETATIKSGDVIVLTGNGQKLYTITKKLTPVTITFNVNGAESIGDTSKQCFKYNGKNSCTIVSPSITPKLNDVAIGWNTSATATISLWNQNTSKDVSSNETYYAITNGTVDYTATFEVQDPNAVSDSSTITRSCTISNGKTSCDVYTPVKVANSGYEILGWSQSQYATTDEVPNSSSVSLTKSNTKYYLVTRKKVTVTYNKNSAESISFDSKSCYKYNGEESCDVNVPKITAKSGETVLGWNTSPTATTAIINTTKTSIVVTSDITYYAITRRSVKYTARFIIQDENAATATNETTITCNEINGQTGCDIPTPTLTAKTGYTALGWSQNKDATNGEIKNGTYFTIFGDETYYSITKNDTPYTATFEIQDANALTTNDSLIQSCYRYNGKNTCVVKTPRMISSNGYKFVGFVDSPDSRNVIYINNEDITLNKDVKYYTLSSKQINIIFKNSSVNKTALIGNSIASCTSYNGDACKITSKDVPLINAPGYMVCGFTKYNQTSIPTKCSSSPINLYASSWDEDATYYTEVNSKKYAAEISNMDYKTTIGRTIIEVDKTLNLTAVTSYIRFLQEELFVNMPELFFAHSKIVLLDENTFRNVLGSTALGLTYTNDYYQILTPTIIIPVENSSTVKNTVKAALVHELGHAFEMYYYYSTITVENFNTHDRLIYYSDFSTMYNRAKNTSPRPLIGYAYKPADGGTGTADGGEFIAEAFRYYYQDKYNTITDPNTPNPSYTHMSVNYINQWIERYLCIARNGYDEGKISCQ